MRRRACTKGRWGRGAVVVAALLTLAFGCCMMFDADHHGMADHGMSQDLCAGVVVFSAAPLSGPVVIDRVSFNQVFLLYSVSLNLPDPPPKSFS